MHLYEKNKRFWELDFLRGIAIVMMFIYHTLFYLNMFGLAELQMKSGFILYFQKLIPIIFITLVGVSLAIVYEKKNQISISSVKHGLIILFWAMMITLVTSFFEKGTVIFGILHLIGVSILISLLFLRFKYLNLLLGIISIAIGIYLNQIIINTRWYVILGLKYWGFYSFDYYPLFPWIGLVFIGIFIGKLLYKKGKRTYKINKLKDYLRPICFLGRHSLKAYLIHIPIIYGIIYLITI